MNYLIPNLGALKLYLVEITVKDLVVLNPDVPRYVEHVEIMSGSEYEARHNGWLMFKRKMSSDLAYRIRILNTYGVDPYFYQTGEIICMG